MREIEEFNPADFDALFARFRSPISELDCGKKCAPYNENGVPFCCDSSHAVPTAYSREWEYLQANTDLWRPWKAENGEDTARLHEQKPRGHMLIVCLGHEHCQRDFRSIACRAFPFFPYITPAGEFTGLSYYWEYEDRCWIINNLHVVRPEYRQEFIKAYDIILEREPDERDNYLNQSKQMRRYFAKRRRAIPLLHRNGEAYKVSPTTGRMRITDLNKLPSFGPYKIAAKLPFPDEIQS